MYVWGKLGEIPAGYKMLDAVTKKAVSTASIQVTWEYADSITIADDGTISLVNPQSTSFKQNSTISQLVDVMIGKYARCTSGGTNGTFIDDYFQPLGTVIYFPSDCVFTRDGDTIRLEASKAHRIEGYAKSTGYVDYLMDANRNAYPDNGQHTDGNTYTYFGKLAEVSAIGAKIEVGSYVGTGSYGGSNPCSITAPFEIKMVGVVVIVENSEFKTEVTNSIMGQQWMATFPLTTAFQYGYGLLYNDNNFRNSYAKKSEDGKTVYWYNTKSATYQMNSAGDVYHYIAIG